MSLTVPELIIDARPRSPSGPLAGVSILGEPLLAQLLDLAAELGQNAPTIHARMEDVSLLEPLATARRRAVAFRPGSPPASAFVLRTDRLYDRRRLRRAYRRGADPEKAVLWRLDSPAALAGAAEECLKRRTYQPLGRFWAIAPGPLIARALRPTAVRPNAVTLVAAALVLIAAALIGAGATADPSSRLIVALALALALVLDTADGHLARLQGSASDFGRWLDANLDELGDMALHAAIAWAAFTRDQAPAWLVAGMIYGMGKYLFYVSNATWDAPRSNDPPAAASPPPPIGMRRLAHWAGHADVRWHAWIVLAATGGLEWELLAFAIYYPSRAVAGGLRKAAGHV